MVRMLKFGSPSIARKVKTIPLSLLYFTLVGCRVLFLCSVVAFGAEHSCLAQACARVTQIKTFYTWFTRYFATEEPKILAEANLNINAILDQHILKAKDKEV